MAPYRLIRTSVSDTSSGGRKKLVGYLAKCTVTLSVIATCWALPARATPYVKAEAYGYSDIDVNTMLAPQVLQQLVSGTASASTGGSETQSQTQAVVGDQGGVGGTAVLTKSETVLAHAAASFGALHAYADVALSTLVASPASGYPGLDANGNSTAFAQFQDTVQFSGNATVIIGLSLNDAITDSGLQYCNTAQCDTATAQTGAFGTDLSLSDTNLSPLGYQTAYATVNVGKGETYDVGSDLFAIVTEFAATNVGCTPPCSAAASGTVDASDTSFLSIQVLTPGVSYTSASGVQYPSTLPSEAVAVSEPTNLSLFGPAFGLFLVFLIRSRTRTIEG